MAEAYIVAATRTAGGRRGGRLAGWHPADLAAQVIDALVARSGIDPAAVEDVILGCVSQVGEQASNVARNAVLASSLPESVPGTTVDRQCGSSQQALHFAAQAVMAGSMDAVIAGGVESMTRVPMFTPNALPAKAGLGTYMSPAMQRRYPGVEFSQFTGAETIAKNYGIVKEALDRYAFETHRRAIAATREGAFADEILPVALRLADGSASGELHQVDEGIRFDVTLEGIAGVKLIAEGGRCTAATASQICDGASGVLVVSERGLKALGVKPLARIHHMSVLGHDPVIMLEAPIPATQRALQSRHEDRGHRPLRDQRGLRAGAHCLAAGAGRRSGAAQCQRRRDRAGPSAGRLRHQAHDHAHPRAGPARQALWAADHVRRRRDGQRDDRREALTPGTP
jgi:acetyl-CoA C-acetyltransferase